MGNTITEKIISLKSGQKKVNPGEFHQIKVDRVMIHDLFGPFVIQQFRKMGFKKVWEPPRVVFIFDHLVPANTIEAARHFQEIFDFADKMNISNVFEAEGICHQIMPEKGFVYPGDVIMGTDSHTCTYGAFGSFSTGIGYTEMAAILGTGEIWVKVPETILFKLSGKLPSGVDAKDIILKIIGDIGTDGATYKTMEFCGDGITGLTMSERMTICNMAVEAGAKNGIIPVDKTTSSYYYQYSLSTDKYLTISSDDDAVYHSTYEYDLSKLEPMVSCPHTVGNVKPVSKVSGYKIHQAFLGSCTNGRLEDLRIAASIIRGRRINPQVRFIVTPASRKIYREAIREGLIQILIDSGAIVTHPGCGLCAGNGGIIGDGERMISSNNRNYIGRMGSKDSEVFLGSPATVAASALTGYIVDPREFIR